MRKKPGPIEFAAVLLALFPSILPANGYPTIHWLGANGTSWTAGNNWSSNASGSSPADFSPNAYTIFSSAGSANSSATSLGGDQSVSSLTISVPDPVGLGGGTLTVNGPVQIQTGTLTITEGGGLVVAGSSPVPQTINALFAANTGGPFANTVSVYNLDNSNLFVTSLGTGILTSPTIVSADANGNLHVLNGTPGAPPKISVFAPDGTHLREINSPDFPYSDTPGFAVGANGTLYLSDTAANSVDFFDSIGTAIGSLTDGLDNPIGLATGANGTLYVANTASSSIGLFTPDGTPFGNATASFPSVLTVGSNGTLYAPNGGLTDTIISLFFPDGIPAGNLTITDPSNIKSLAVAPDGTLFASYQGSQSISVFSSNGTSIGNISENVSAPFGLWTGNFTTETLAFNGITLAASSSDTATLNIGTFGGNDTTVSVAAHSIQFGDGTATINLNLAGNFTLDAPLTGGGIQSAVNQLGTGTTTLSSTDSTYAGAIHIHAGTLAITGSIANSSTHIHAGGTLVGDGILGTLAIHTGGTISPGSAHGISTLTVGDSTWNGGGIYELQFSSVNGTAGTDWDFLTSTGSLTVNSTSGDKFVIDATAREGSGFDPSAESYKWQIAQFSGNITGFSPEKFDILASGFNGTSGLGTFSVSTNSTSLALNYRTLFAWTAGNGSWSVQTDWLDNAAPVEGGPIQFAGPGGISTNDSLASIASLAFTANATGAYTLDGGNLTLGSGGLTNNSQHSQTIALNLAFSEDQTFASTTANLVVIGNITGAASLAKTGNQSLVLSGANALSGNTTVFSGELAITAGSLSTQELQIGNGGNGTLHLSGGAIEAAGSLIALFENKTGTATITGGTWNNASYLSVGEFGIGTLNLTGGTVSVGNGTGTLDLARQVGSVGTLNIGTGTTAGTLSVANVAAGNGTATVNFHHSGDLVFAPALTGNLALNQLGGTTTLTAANTHTGGTTITSGTLQIGNGGSTGFLIGDIANEAALVFNRANDLVFSGAISGNGSLTKLGAGTLTLNSTSHEGGTFVEAGTLFVTGTMGSVTVNNSATLAGTPSLGDVAINAGGAIAPGNSAGTLAVANLTLHGGAIYHWQTSSINGTAGTAWDLVSSSGALALNATAANPVTINLATLGNATLAGVKTASWRIGFFPSGITGFDPSAFSFNSTNMTGNGGGYFMSLGDGNSSLLLNYVAAEIFPSVSALGNFTSSFGVPSASRSFTVNGTNLVGNITVSAPAGFEVSTDNSSFTANVSFTQTGGNVANATVYARTSATINAGNATGNITLSSPGADDKLVALNSTVAPAPLAVAINAQPIQTRAGSQIISTQPPNSTHPRVTVTANGTALANATVTATVNQFSGNFSGNTTLTTNATGVAVFNNITLNKAAAGYTLTFTANATNYSSANATSSQFPIIAASAANATITTPPGNATYGSSLSPSAVVTLTDLYGNPVSNTNITALLPGGNFTSSSNTTVRTSTNGTAAFPNLFPAAAGNFTLVFDTAAAGVPDLTSNLTVSRLATTLTIGNATMQAAASLPTNLSVSPAPSFSATAFSQNASAILGNFTFTTTNTTAVGTYPLGIAPGTGGSFANYNITTVNGTLAVTAGNASQLAEVSTPVTTEAGRPLEGVNMETFAPEAPTIFVGDEFGNPVSGVTVNATLSANPGNATLNGTTSLVTDGNGTAVFSDLTITKAADGYKLTYAAAGLTSLTSEEFNIEPAAAGNITVFTQPGNTTAGQLIPGTTDAYPAVQLLDEYGNAVNRAYNIEATLLTANFTANFTTNSTTTVLTDETGYGVFEDLATTKSGTFQIQFVPLAAGNINTTSANFTVDPDFTTANISVTTQPGNSTAGELLPGPPTAQILDQYDNPIGNYTVSATLSTGNFSANSTTSNTTDSTGTAVLGDLRIETADNYTIDLSFTETTSGNSSVATSNFTVNPAAPSKLVMVTEPSATAQAGIAIATQPAVRLQDSFSNNVSQSGTVVGATVNEVNGVNTVNATAGGNTTATTDGNGTATFSGLSINGTVGNYTLSFSSGNLTSANSTTTIALSAGNATQLSVSTQPSTTAMANATFSQQPVVQILDAWSNHVTTDNSTIVAASLNTGGLSGNLSGTANATASSGNASFSGLAIAGQAGNYTLTFNATGLTAATSNTTQITADLTTANITMGTQPGNSTAGSAIVGAPSISILDQYNNPVGNYTVRAALNGATLTSNSTRNVATGTDGNATFSNLITNTSGTGYTLAFSFNATIPTTAGNSTTSSNFTVSPDAAFGLVMVSQPPTTAQAGVPFDDANAPQVRVKDRFNNNVPVANMTITATANGGSGSASGETTALTDESGTATFYGLGISGTVGTYTLTFANGTLTNNATSSGVTLTPGLPTKVVVAQQPPATVQANATLSPAPAVSLQDTWNNNVTTPGLTVNATLQGAGASLNGTGSTTTNATGVANFGDLRIQGSVGNYTLLFTSGNFASANSTNIEVTADQSTAAISVTTNATTSTAGQIIQGSPAATIEDQYGNVLSGYSVTAALNGAALASGTTTVNTDVSGAATFSDLVTNTAGDFTLTFSFDENGASGNATTAAFTVNPDVPTVLSITTQPSATAQAGIALAQQPVVQIQDQFGNNNPESGVEITAAADGGATANGSTTASTDGNGTATFSGLFLEGAAGNYTLTFSNFQLASATSNSIALGAGNATKLVIATQPGNSTATGTAFAPQPAVKLQDAWSNDVSQSGVSVTAAVTTGNASVGGNTTASTDGSGVAAFDGLTINGTVGDYTLTFNATGLTDAVSDTVAVTANPATAVISISANATTSVAGQPFAGPPAATIVDGSNNPLSGISVTAAINQNSGNFSGTTSVSTDSNGVASFGNLMQTVAATGYNLTLSFNNGQTSGNATTANFAVTAAAASNMTVSRQPSNTIAGVAIAGSGGGSPSARLRDAFGNPVISQNVTVTLQTGNFTGNSTAIVATDATGNATFSNLVCTTAGFYNLSFASGNLSRVTNGFNIFASTGTSLALVNTLQTTAQAGVALSPQPVVQIRDTFGNNATQGNVTITVAASAGGINGGSTSVLTNANGTASYSSLLLTGAVGNRTLTFSAAGLTPAVSPAIDLTAGAAASLVVNVEPATSFIAGAELTGPGYTGAPTVTVQDAYGNPVSTTVNATGVGFSSFGNGSVTSLPTDGNGTVAFADLMVVQAGQNQRVNFATGNVSANTQTFNVFPSDPTSMTVTAQPPTSIGSGAVLSPNPAVTLYDAFKNTVTSLYEVEVTLNGNGTLSGTTNMTTSGGVATFTSLSVAQLGNYTLSFRTLGYDPELSATSSAFSIVSPNASGLAITGISAVDATTYQVAFTAQQGGNYWIQRTTDLKNGPWTYVSTTASIATIGVNTPVTVTTPGGTKAFWRLTTQPPTNN